MLQLIGALAEALVVAVLLLPLCCRSYCGAAIAVSEHSYCRCVLLASSREAALLSLETPWCLVPQAEVDRIGSPLNAWKAVSLLILFLSYAQWFAIVLIHDGPNAEDAPGQHFTLL